MPVKGPNEFFGEIENEHLLGRVLFKGARGDILRVLVGETGTKTEGE